MGEESKKRRWEVFLDSLLMEEDPFFLELRKSCEADGIPVIRRETEYFLKWLLAQMRPDRILEIGTAYGYSSIYMASHLPKDAKIVSIEKRASSVQRARENIAKAQFSDRVLVIEGDAATVLSQKEGSDLLLAKDSFSMIFLDGPKAQYGAMLPELLSLLSPGGVLVSDNILQEGRLMESRFAVERRDRTIHKRMREYVYVITHCEGLTTDILPIGDGLAVSAKDFV